MVHGHDGLDEISVCAATRISELSDRQVRTSDINPEQFFGEADDPADLVGGDPAQNAEITRKILKGEKGPCRNVVALNAGVALVAAGKATDFKEGIQLAQAAIDNGSAQEKLDALIRYTQENG